MTSKQLIFPEYERELHNKLFTSIVKDGFVDEDTVIVNVSPTYSSRLVQSLSHILSYSNKNQLHEVINLELPSKNMTQVWNVEEREYQLFDKYLYNWVNKYFKADQKYLFVVNTIFTGKHLDKLRKLLSVKMQKFALAGYNYRIACLFCDEISVVKPDFFAEGFGAIPPIFIWENTDLQ